MMQPFNLAKQKILERKFCRRFLAGRLRNSVILLLVATLVAVHAEQYRKPINKANSTVVAQLKDVQSGCQTLRNEIGGDRTIIGRSSWQDQLAHGTEQRAGLIKAILSTVPSDTWIDSVGDFDKDSFISVNGIAPTFSSISEFSSALRQCPLIHNVRLKSTSIVARASGQYICFTFELQTGPTVRPDTGRDNGAARVPKLGGSQ